MSCTVEFYCNNFLCAFAALRERFKYSLANIGITNALFVSMKKNRVLLNTFYTVFTFVLISTLPACAQKNIAASSVSYELSEANIKTLQNDILRLVNKHRASKGLNALQMSETANIEATKHSADMARGRMGFGHGGFDERMSTLNKKLGGLRATGENVAYGKIGAEEVMDMWLHSSGHKKNIEGNFSMMGIGIAQSRDGYLYFTQIFLLK